MRFILILLIATTVVDVMSQQISDTSTTIGTTWPQQQQQQSLYSYSYPQQPGFQQLGPAINYPYPNYGYYVPLAPFNFGLWAPQSQQLPFVKDEQVVEVINSGISGSVPISPLQAAVLDLQNKETGHSEQYFYGRNLEKIKTTEEKKEEVDPEVSSISEPDTKTGEESKESTAAEKTERAEEIVQDNSQDIVSLKQELSFDKHRNQNVQKFSAPEPILTRVPPIPMTYPFLTPYSYYPPPQLPMESIASLLALKKPLDVLSNPNLEKVNTGKPFTVNKKKHYEIYMYE